MEQLAIFWGEILLQTIINLATNNPEISIFGFLSFCGLDRFSIFFIMSSKVLRSFLGGRGHIDRVSLY